MKGYRTFLFIVITLLAVYVIAALNKPAPVNWTVTLSNADKNPYGSYILYNELKQLFPKASRQSFREPAYDLLNNFEGKNNVYIIITPGADIGKADMDALLHFVKQGNYVFLSAFQTSQKLMDTLGLETDISFNIISDSTNINFTNPSLKAKTNYRFRNQTIDQYFKKINKKDSTVVLGINQNNDANFVKVQYGNGAFYVHAAPLCFSNYFMLFHNNHEYISKALSYLPADADNIFWDEYYKLGREGAATPLRFILSNVYLQWALRFTIILLILFVLFNMKRRQRIIPVIEPLRNTSLDFIKTVSSVYFNQHDNKGIAGKKIQYWLEYIRQRYYVSTQNLDEEFVQQLKRKSGASAETIQTIISYAKHVEEENRIDDTTLFHINQIIDSFYQSSQS